MGVSFTVNTDVFVKKLGEYDHKVNGRFTLVLLKYAGMIRDTQRGILRVEVKRWTGWLENSIMFRRRNARRYWIGPGFAYPANKKGGSGPYEKYIEFGSASGQTGAPDFDGYHYVEDSTKDYVKRFQADIRKIVESVKV